MHYSNRKPNQLISICAPIGYKHMQVSIKTYGKFIVHNLLLSITLKSLYKADENDFLQSNKFVKTTHKYY